jgi:hypothetical protein
MNDETPILARVYLDRRYTERVGDKIALREAGWTWKRKLRRWEKKDEQGNVMVSAKTMHDALRAENGLPPLPHNTQRF